MDQELLNQDLQKLSEACMNGNAAQLILSNKNRSPSDLLVGLAHYQNIKNGQSKLKDKIKEYENIIANIKEKEKEMQSELEELQNKQQGHGFP